MTHVQVQRGGGFLDGRSCTCAVLHNSRLCADFFNVPRTNKRCTPSVPTDYSVCVLLLNRFQLQTQGLPFCFKFPAQNVQGVHVRESQVLIKFFILCVHSFDILHCTFLFVCTQTSVFTPAFGSVTNVRVNSSMTTVQVLNLLLHKFRVSRNKTLVTD